MPYMDLDQRREYARTWAANRRLDWIESQGGRCAECGSTDRLEVDHIDPSLKTMNPTNLWSRTAAVREAELANCQVLCHDCHFVKSMQVHDHPTIHGTSNGYEKRACRCDECRGWNSARVRRSRANRIALESERAA